MQQIITSKEFQSLQHAIGVAFYIGASAFIATFITSINNDPVIAYFLAHHIYAALLFTLINMLLAAANKYIQLHKAEIEQA